MVGLLLLKQIDNLSDAFRGEAERLGLKTERDVVAMVKEVRRERSRARND